MTAAAAIRNLRLFVAYRAGMSLLVYIAISLPFYQSLGFNLAEIGILYSITGFVVFVFDVPTGFVADRIGYRRMMILGTVVQALAYSLLAVTYSQWPVYLIHVGLGLGQAISRGADGPLARISADEIGANFSYYSRLGISVMGLAEGAASLGTAVLAWQLGNNAPRTAMALQGIIYLTTAYLPQQMYEPPKRKLGVAMSISSASGYVATRVARMARVVASELRSNREARWLVLYGATIGCTTQTVVNLVQPYFQSLGLSPLLFALLWTGYHWAWSAFSLAAGWYERRLGRVGALASLVAWGVITNAAMAFVGGMAGLGIMTAFYFIRGIQMPIVLDYMTGVVREERRATLLAVQGSTQFAMFTIMNILLGAVAEMVSVRAAFAVSLVVYGTLGTTFIWLLRHTHKQLP